MKKISREFSLGFTLIELLVVVAIIAILSSIVMVSIGNARGKSADGAVKANLNTVRGLSEIYYANNANSFGSFGPATCPTSGGTGMFSNVNIQSAIAEAVNNGTNGSSCVSAPGSWAVAVGLKTSGVQAWCIDSSGASRRVTITLNTPSTGISGTSCIAGS